MSLALFGTALARGEVDGRFDRSVVVGPEISGVTSSVLGSTVVAPPADGNSNGGSGETVAGATLVGAERVGPATWLLASRSTVPQ